MAISRRKALKALGAVPVAASFTWTAAEAGRHTSTRRRPARRPPHRRSRSCRSSSRPHEWATVRMLVDLIIPKDERSGSATDAGVPEFMDFMMLDQPAREVAMRGGLKWLDTECLRRFDKTFLGCAPPSARRCSTRSPGRTAKATPLLSQGVAFFSSFRDLTASGFW